MKLTNCDLCIDDTPQTIEEITEKSKKMSLNGALDLIVIDYLELCSTEDITARRLSTLKQEILILDKLKALAKDINCPVLVLTQLSRKVEEREDKHPLLTDIHPDISGKADIIILLYRDDYYFGCESESKGLEELLVAKNNCGKTGNVALIYIPEYVMFRNTEKAWRRSC
jgi:replicative DNA helicase